MRKLWLFYERTLNYSTKWSESGKNLRRWLEIDGNGGEKYTNWTLTRPNHQQDLNQDTNSILQLKYAKAMVRKGCRTGKGYGTGLMGRTHEHSKLRVDVNLTLFLKLRLSLDENKGGPIFRKVLVTLDLVEMRHKSIRLPNNTIRNPTIFFLFFWYFSLTRSTKEVTTENLSLNKWKTSPAEFSQGCEKCEKNFTRWKLKLWRFWNFQTRKCGDRHIRIFFLIDFDIWNNEIGVRMWKLWMFYERTLN